MAASSPRGALVGLRAGAMSGAASVALCLGVMVAIMLLGGADPAKDLAGSTWMHHAVVAAGVGAGVGVILGGLVGAILGRMGQMPMIAAIVGGALAVGTATVFYLVRIHAALDAVVQVGVGSAAAGAALGILLWLPFAAWHALVARLRR